jgi:hypothetical protein
MSTLHTRSQFGPQVPPATVLPHAGKRHPSDVFLLSPTLLTRNGDANTTAAVESTQLSIVRIRHVRPRVHHQALLHQGDRSGQQLGDGATPLSTPNRSRMLLQNTGSSRRHANHPAIQSTQCLRSGKGYRCARLALAGADASGTCCGPQNDPRVLDEHLASRAGVSKRGSPPWSSNTSPGVGVPQSWKVVSVGIPPQATQKVMQTRLLGRAGLFHENRRPSHLALRATLGLATIAHKPMNTVAAGITLVRFL